jgi:hypothetical protein
VGDKEGVRKKEMSRGGDKSFASFISSHMHPPLLSLDNSQVRLQASKEQGKATAPAAPPVPHLSSGPSVASAAAVVGGLPVDGVAVISRASLHPDGSGGASGGGSGSQQGGKSSPRMAGGADKGRVGGESIAALR